MPTLGELMEKFGSAAASQNDDAGDNHVPAARQNPAVGFDGHNKTASGGDAMKSLTDIYLTLTQVDMNKEAAAAAHATDDDVDFAKMAEAMADAEATELVQQDVGGNDGDIVKIAQEYDSAGRIMARGFFDEFQKLAGALDTAASENQMTETESKASTPALGSRGLPTMETNFAGSANHDQKMETAGQAAKQVYLDSLAPTKSISAGAGTGDDPEAAAISLGSGSPAGFATVKDLQV
jgi:hypothetical protein